MQARLLGSTNLPLSKSQRGLRWITMTVRFDVGNCWQQKSLRSNISHWIPLLILSICYSSYTFKLLLLLHVLSKLQSLQHQTSFHIAPCFSPHWTVDHCLRRSHLLHRQGAIGCNGWFAQLSPVDFLQLVAASGSKSKMTGISPGSVGISKNHQNNTWKWQEMKTDQNGLNCKLMS